MVINCEGDAVCLRESKVDIIFWKFNSVLMAFLDLHDSYGLDEQ